MGTAIHLKSESFSQGTGLKDDDLNPPRIVIHPSSPQPFILIYPPFFDILIVGKAHKKKDLYLDTC